MPDTTASRTVKPAIDAFQGLIGRHGCHAVTGAPRESGEGVVYVQPPVSLGLHLVQMRTAGWRVEFDEVATVSGASALFAFEPSSMMPKYAHLLVEPERRIAEATGFGYEWLSFGDAAAPAEEAWLIVQRSVRAGRAVKGFHWEFLLFAGYEDAPEPAGRRVYALIDGPETSAGWWSWAQFEEWLAMMAQCGTQRLGRYTTHIIAKAPSAVARRVLADLVAWSAEPPEAVRAHYPDAAFGLAGIAAYAEAVGDPEAPFAESAWRGCHAINPQWTLRRCTAVYLERVAGWGIFPETMNRALRGAAASYRACYDAWTRFYARLGHGASASAWADPAARRAGGGLVREWLAHESAAVEALSDALRQHPDL